MKKIARGLMIMMMAAPAMAQTAPISGYCTLGATPADTYGMTSSNTLQGIVPLCLVTVYYTGTTNEVAGNQIYKDGIGTVLGNPFTAASDGSWLFYAAMSQGYDVMLSGGTYPNVYPIPKTLTDVNAGGGTVTSFTAPAISWPSWLTPAVTNSATTPSLAVTAGPIPDAALASQAANTVLGALTVTTPSPLAMPSCSGVANALTWTSGAGFGCNTIAGNVGTVTTTGAPVSGNLAAFSGATSITNGNLSGDVTTSGTLGTTLATVNSNTGSFGSSTAIPSFTVNGKGLITAAGTYAVIAPAGTLTGTTLAANVLASSLTGVGTLNSLSVSGNETLGGTLALTAIGSSASPLCTTAGGVVTNSGCNSSLYSLIARVAFNSCTMADDGGGGSMCTGTVSWGATLPATYYAWCQTGYNSGAGGCTATSGTCMAPTVGLVSQTTTILTYEIDTRFNNGRGNTVPMICWATN